MSYHLCIPVFNKIIKQLIDSVNFHNSSFLFVAKNIRIT